MQKFSKVILTVLDGFGIASPSPYNAVSVASPNFFQELIAWYPTHVLQASGPAVGLPWGEHGNSEVGHLHLGSGRVVTQELPRINRSIADGSFFTNEVFRKTMLKTAENKGTLHIAGLLGVGSVHSYAQHLNSLLGMCKDLELSDVALHIFTDGVDSPTKTAVEMVQKLEQRLIRDQTGRIATVTGRFYAMDKGDHWDLTKKTLDAMVSGEGEKFVSASDAANKRYSLGISDEMIPPSVIVNEKGEATTIKPGDGIIFFNFRSDRMMQLLKLLLQQIKDVSVVTMSLYDPSFGVEVAFMPEEVKGSIGEVVSKKGYTQFHAAESDKFAHVTFFFNGHRFEPWPGEERLILKSHETSFKNYDETPAMSARELTDSVVERILKKNDKLVLVNYANADLIGHTGNLQAAAEGIKVIDQCLARLADAAAKTASLLVVTADHGNCENMRDTKTGEVDKEHTSNPVPAIFFGPGLKKTLKSRLNLYTLAGLAPDGILADVAPTSLHLLGYEPPPDMTGSVIAI